jgi:hypothetical protein
MAEILAFVKNDRRPARPVPGPVDSSEVVVFPRASVRVHGLWTVTADGIAVPSEGRVDA